jgi:drug/metabolite transporter (DMT)-like permease
MWQLYVLISTIFFVAGQTLIKMSTADALDASILFMTSIGATALLYGLCFKKDAFSLPTTDLKTTLWIALAGAAFFIGNILWIKAIKTVDNFGFVRILMAGLEIALLLIVALLIFKEKTSWKVIAITFTGCSLLVYAALM